jgi:flagellar hook-basal body complex protein FliE
MTFPLAGLLASRPIQPVEIGGQHSSGTSFQSILQSAIRNVENSTATAETHVQDFLSGSSQDLHTAILATQNAQLNLDEFLQMRNKVVSAYEEIMKMQL